MSESEPDPLTFEFGPTDDGALSADARGVLAAFVPPAENEQPVVAFAADPRNRLAGSLDELAPDIVQWLRRAVGPRVEEAIWTRIDNYGRFNRALINWQAEPLTVLFPRFDDGVSVDAFFKTAGATGEAAVELLSAVLEAPRPTEALPTEAEFLDAIEAHTNLPAPGVIFQKLEVAAQDGDAKQIAAVVQPDPVISASLVNAANAARFAGTGKTGSVPQAVVRLGTSFVRRVVFVAEMMARYQKGACRAFDYRGFWMNAIANGACSRALLEEFDLPERYGDDMFMAGLISGIGWLATAETYPDLMARYLERCHVDGKEADPITKARAYNEIFPCPLKLVSERYLERFEFPDRIRQAIVGRDEEFRDWYDCLARGVRVANSLSPFICNMVPTTIPAPPACREEWERWRTMAQA